MLLPGRYRSSRAPVKSSSRLKPFFRRESSACRLTAVHIPAARQPVRMAGTRGFHSRVPLLRRSRVLTMAAGRKNSRFVPRAVLGS